MTGSGPSRATLIATERAGAAVDRTVDHRLLDRASHGDIAAFDEILGPRLPRMYRMAVAITRSEADARDAVQDASVNAWRELRRLRSPDRFDSWLDQILVNACRSMLRRSRRVQVREVELESVGGGGDGGAVVGLGVTVDPDQSEVDLIRRAFERLEPGVRALLVLHYVEERPLADIARATGSPVGTIKWRLSNARRALDRALEVERR
jgi:RNA polymerase sigma-70 factor (ECF subfamily)